MIHRKCLTCSFKDSFDKQHCPGVGPEQTKYAIVGEAPGFAEAKKKVPFVGPSGVLLGKVLDRVGLDRSTVYVTNVVKCRPTDPTGRKSIAPKAALAHHCGMDLDTELKARGVKYVLALGVTAMKHLTNGTSMRTARGRAHHNKALNAVVISTYHPAAVLRNDRLFPDMARDITMFADGRFAEPATELEGEAAYSVANTLWGALSLLNEMAEHKAVVVDIETSGYSTFKDRILCMAFSWQPRQAVVVPKNILYMEAFKHALAKQVDKHRWIGHNVQFDLRWVYAQLGVRLHAGFDTMLANYTFDERGGVHDLKHVVGEVFNIADWEVDLKRYLKKPKTDSFAMLPLEVLYTYAAKDADYTFRLYEHLREKLDEHPVQAKLMYEHLMPAADAFVDIVHSGIRIDVEHLERLREQYKQRAAEAEDELRVITGDANLNPRSTQQVRHWLYDVFKAPTYSQSYRPGHSPKLAAPGSAAGKGEHTTAMEQLERLMEGYACSPFANALIQYRRSRKMVRSYLRHYVPEEDGRIHPSFLLHGTVTGRLSARNPNVLNPPHELGIRELFIPEEGNVIVSADYSQNELRVLAAFSQAPGLCQLYKEGKDLHHEACLWMYGPDYTDKDRMIAKSINFGMVYGRSAQNISLAFGAPVGQVQDYISTFHGRAGPEVREWMAYQRGLARNRGYVETPFGRRRRFPLVTDRNIKEIWRQAINAPIQGTSSDLMLRSIYRINRWLGHYGGVVLMPLHDSILFEVPKAVLHTVIPRIRATMEAVPREIFGDIVPFKVDIVYGERWGDKKALKEYTDGEEDRVEAPAS